MMICDKATMYRLLQAGVLGNATRTWTSPEAFRASGFQGLCAIRGLTPGLPFLRGLTVGEVLEQSHSYPGAHLIVEAIPQDAVLFAGEVTRMPGGLHLRWSSEKQTLRQAMLSLNAQECTGLRAKLLLDHYLDAGSRDDLEVLLDMYPEHVVEFGVYQGVWGAVPHRNTVVWEVRKY